MYVSIYLYPLGHIISNIIHFPIINYTRVNGFGFSQKPNLAPHIMFGIILLKDDKEPKYRDMYLIKWKGWSSMHNTWEPKDNLNCTNILQSFHIALEQKKSKRKINIDYDVATKRQKLIEVVDDILEIHNLTPVTLIQLSTSPTKTWKSKFQQVVRKRLGRSGTNRSITNKRSKAYKQLQQNMQLQLKEWENKINALNTDPAPITVENTVDLEGPPSTFFYINNYKPMSGITIPDDPIIGCSCTDCIRTKKNCCGQNAGMESGYYRNRRVRVAPGNAIYECNKRCRCSSDCYNRVVQRGRRHKMCIFRTENCRGWGVKTLQRIPKGTFVMEYVGEVSVGCQS